jgi:hypothetical protein
MDAVQDPVEEAASVTLRFREAVEAGDVEGVMEVCSPHVVLRSPISYHARFEGIDALRGLVRQVFNGVIEDIRFFEDVGDEWTRALFYSARVRGQTIEEAQLIRLDEQRRIAEITLYVRPLPGLTALTTRLGVRLARQQSFGRALVAAAMTRPLAWLTRKGDRPAVKLTKVG